MTHIYNTNSQVGGHENTNFLTQLIDFMKFIIDQLSSVETNFSICLRLKELISRLVCDTMWEISLLMQNKKNWEKGKTSFSTQKNFRFFATWNSYITANFAPIELRLVLFDFWYLFLWESIKNWKFIFCTSRTNFSHRITFFDDWINRLVLIAYGKIEKSKMKIW